MSVPIIRLRTRAVGADFTVDVSGVRATGA